MNAILAGHRSVALGRINYGEERDLALLQGKFLQFNIQLIINADQARITGIVIDGDRTRGAIVATQGTGAAIGEMRDDGLAAVAIESEHIDWTGGHACPATGAGRGLDLHRRVERYLPLAVLHHE
jgi:LDH2 family malate/lactate/ureidoglycolate dehydrogenase